MQPADTLEDSLRQIISASKSAPPALAEQKLLALDTHGAKLVRSLHYHEFSAPREKFSKEKPQSSLFASPFYAGGKRTRVD
jgi:hypothetical protein